MPKETSSGPYSGFAKLVDRILGFLSSLKLAVVVILLLTILSSVGTFVEAKYDATIAKKLVYDTWWMYATMGLLAINLTAVMMDRWPWKRRHVPFILAHIGILVLLFGSVLTAKFGIDGSMRVEIGGVNRWITLPNTDLSIWTSFDGERFSKLMEKEVDFFVRPPKNYPVELTTEKGKLAVLDYKPFVVPSKKVVATSEGKGAGALRFQVQNMNANVIEWLVQKRPNEVVTHNFGPAQLHFGNIPDGAMHGGTNEIYFKLRPDGALDYKVLFRDGSRKPVTGIAKEGETFKPGWMDLTIHILRVLPQAEEVWEFQELSAPTPLSTSAAEIEFEGKRHWLQLNDTLKIFSDKAVYIIAYANRRVDLGFEIFLKNFEVGRYQGTMRAASYASQVEVQGIGLQNISMNEPLHHAGRTVYQASFQDGPDGNPVASIFSINEDPGLWLKYLGSLILTIGTIWMFYDKRRAARAMAPKKLELKS